MTLPRWTGSPWCGRHAGREPPTPLLLEPGEFATVDTGDPMPDGFDAVVMREHVHREEAAPSVREAAAPYQHVRSIGEDVSATELLPRATGCGRSRSAPPPGPGEPARARARPIVTVIPTGDEVRPVGAEIGPG